MNDLKKPAWVACGDYGIVTYPKGVKLIASSDQFKTCSTYPSGTVETFDTNAFIQANNFKVVSSKHWNDVGSNCSHVVVPVGWDNKRTKRFVKKIENFYNQYK